MKYIHTLQHVSLIYKVIDIDLFTGQRKAGEKTWTPPHKRSRVMMVWPWRDPLAARQAQRARHRLTALTAGSAFWLVFSFLFLILPKSNEMFIRKWTKIITVYGLGNVIFVALPSFFERVVSELIQMTAQEKKEQIMNNITLVMKSKSRKIMMQIHSCVYTFS